MNKHIVRLVLALAVSAVLVVSFADEIRSWEQGLDTSLMRIGLSDASALNPTIVYALPTEDLPIVASGDINAYQALQRYPEQTRELWKAFGNNKLFVDGLKDHGPRVIPVIHACYKDDSLSTDVKEKIVDLTIRAWHSVVGQPATTPTTPLSKEMRRGYSAVVAIAERHEQFLQCWDIDILGNAHYQYVRGGISLAEMLFVGGIEKVEKKFWANENITGWDLGEAGLDTVTFLSLAKVVKLRAIATEAKLGEEAVEASRFAKIVEAPLVIANVGRDLWKTSRVFRIMVYTGGIYVLVYHPDLINAGLGWVAKNVLNVDPVKFQLLFWAMMLLAPFYICPPLWWGVRWSGRKIHERFGRDNTGYCRTCAQPLPKLS